MGRDWFVLGMVLVFSISSPGCFSEKEEFYYSVDDPEDGTNSDSTSDVLFSITLDDQGGMDMDFSDLVVIIERDSGSHTCATTGTTGNCSVVQPSGSDDSTWEIGETLNITENGVDICSQHCILAFIVSGPEDAKIVGPTILNTT